MQKLIRFYAYEIESKVWFICKQEKLKKDMIVKSLVIIPEDETKMVSDNQNLSIPEIFM